MRTSELLKILIEYGCYFLKHNGNHDEWFSPITGKKFYVWRHAGEIPTGTANAILKQAGIK